MAKAVHPWLATEKSRLRRLRLGVAKPACTGFLSMLQQALYPLASRRGLQPHMPPQWVVRRQAASTATNYVSEPKLDFSDSLSKLKRPPRRTNTFDQ